MKALWIVALLLITACAQPSPVIEQMCLTPIMSYRPYTSLDFVAVSAIPLQVAIEDACKDIGFVVRQEGDVLVVNLTSTPIVGCVDTCTENESGLPSTPMYMVHVPLDFAAYKNVASVVVTYDGRVVETLPVDGALCSKHACPSGYACVDDSVVPGPDGTCRRADCGSAGAAQCPGGYSCILEEAGGAGSCVKDIPVDYCERDWDCVRQSSTCDCGLGEWVNHRFYRPVPDGAPVCACAWRDAMGACRENHCVGVPDTMSEPAVNTDDS
jgi:hypothetical protein